MKRELTLFCTAILMCGCTWDITRPDGVERTVSASHASKAADVPERVEALRKSLDSPQEALEKAERATRAGDFDEAERLLNEVLKMDPLNDRAKAELDEVHARSKHADLIEDARILLDKQDEFGAERRLRQVLTEDSHNVDAQTLLMQIIKKREARRLVAPVLKTNGSAVTLEFREAPVRMVFDAISRTTGINFIFDKDITPDQKITIFLKAAPLADVLDSLLTANQLNKKILNENTVVIYPDSPMKIRDYQELEIKNFYLSNADPNKVSGLLKGMLQMRDVFVDDKNSSLMVRDTPETIRLAEQIIRMQDVADPEVMLELEVLEVNRTKALDLGIQYPNKLAVITDPLTLSAIRKLTTRDISISPSPELTFKKTDGITNLLANPSIRVRNREKAHVHVGSRKPIFTTNVSQGGAGLISETVQYIEDGLKLEVEPTINIDDEVSIKIALEYSTSSATENKKAFTIQTRNANTLLRLKDGETQILAGLIKDQDDITENKVPGLGDIPFVGRLFNNQTQQKDKTDLILSITPHVIRNRPSQSAESADIMLGPESAQGRLPTTFKAGTPPASLAPFMMQRTPTAPAAGSAGAAPATAPAAPSQPAPAPQQSNPTSLPSNLMLPMGTGR